MTAAEAPDLEDIISEPNADAFIGFAQAYDVRHGKFIRVGNVILVAPMVGVAPDDMRPSHLNMIWAGARNPNMELAQKVQLAASHADLSKGLPKRSDLMDAGSYLISLSESGGLAGVEIDDESYEFGRAGTEGRAETVAIMRDYLADVAIEVTGK